MQKSAATTEPRGNGEDRISIKLPAEESRLSVLTPPGLASIIIPCVGQVEYTQLCVPSVLRHTRGQAYELIFIDIGSLDGTATYLAGVRDCAPVRVEVVRAATDLRIKEAVYEALSLARGEYVVLLNNDTVVTDSWLAQMINLSGITNIIGLVGPMSNYAEPQQRVETVPYRVGPRKGAGWRPGLPPEPLVDVSAIDRFAAEYRDRNRRDWKQVDQLGGFCLLVKRAVLRKIEQTGPLREWTDLRLFDTDFLGQKAKQAGFTLACARDLFVHHFGSRIFAHGAPNAQITHG